MPQREKTSVRLDPEIVSLGRRLAKQDFGSEQKFGLLIESSIKAYYARQVDPTHASSLLSATEQALIERVEQRVEDMGKRTVERVGNLIAKSSYETALSNVVLENLYADIHQDGPEAKSNLEQFRHVAAGRMKNRFDKESADNTTSLLEENQQLEKANRELQKELEERREADKQINNNANRYYQRTLDMEYEIKQYKERINELEEYTREIEKANKSLKFFKETAEKNRDIHRQRWESVSMWSQGLIQRLEERRTFGNPSKTLHEYESEHPRPEFAPFREE